MGDGELGRQKKRETEKRLGETERGTRERARGGRERERERVSARERLR